MTGQSIDPPLVDPVPPPDGETGFGAGGAGFGCGLTTLGFVATRCVVAGFETRGVPDAAGGLVTGGFGATAVPTAPGR
ncbi:MAG TPA: hypothetical protein VGC90_00360, partial [Candidatus Limnocylindrales bacterium]